MPRRKSLQLRVTVISKHDKLYLRCRYPDGTEQIRVAKSLRQSEALREAGAWENALRAESEQRAYAAAPENLTWQEFRTRFSREHLSSLAITTQLTYESVLDGVERILKPKLLTDPGPSQISDLQSILRKEGSSEANVAKYLRHLKAGLQWAYNVQMLREVPRFPVIKRARQGSKPKPMKGRPISEAGYLAALEAIPLIVPETTAANWRFLMQAFWWGGLRIEESLDLTWDVDSEMRVDLDSARFPRLVIPDHTDKSGESQLFPIAPEFANLLRQVPESERKGHVFHLASKGSKQVTPGYVSHTITAICAKAGVVTNSVRHKSRGGELGDHFAGAHDFRRAFGTRWARRVLPQILQKMMRHANINTTLSYYVELDTDDTAEDIWAAYEQVLKR